MTTANTPRPTLTEFAADEDLSALRGKTARDLTLEQILAIQKQAYREDPQPSAKVRRDRISRMKRLVLDNAKDFAEALRLDYGSRPETLSIMAEIASAMPELDHQRSHLASWMKPDKPSRILDRVGYYQEVRHDPKGVVGVVGPWNFPLFLAVVPGGTALGAGNRVMIRTSSVTKHVTELFCNLGPKYFPVDEVAFIGPEHGRGADFSVLPFDHLFFTGSPGVGKSVAKDAAENYTTVTLELGGKNPVVVAPDADIEKVARNVAISRMVNGGQVCVCPDFVFVPRAQVEKFNDTVIATWEECFPKISGNPEYTAIINDSNYERIVRLIADAKEKGAGVRQVVPGGESLPNAEERKIAPTLLTDVTAEMEIDGDETFGPVLTVHAYDDLGFVVDYISERPNPLVLYWYGDMGDDFDYVVSHTKSGNVFGNNFGAGMVSTALPFGGSGMSGQGNYHGKWGFRTFSQERAVGVTNFDYIAAEAMVPPINAAKKRQADIMLKVMKARTKFLG